MKFRSGYTYTGQFKDNVPHGTGKFLYPNGDVEDAIMEAGLRHGQSRYLCEEDKTVEEVTFSEGVATGDSKVINQINVKTDVIFAYEFFSAFVS